MELTPQYPIHALTLRILITAAAFVINLPYIYTNARYRTDRLIQLGKIYSSVENVP